MCTEKGWGSAADFKFDFAPSVNLGRNLLASVRSTYHLETTVCIIGDEMSFNITRVLLVLSLSQGLACNAWATETRSGFYNAEVDNDKPILTINLTNNKADADNTFTYNGVTTKQTSNIKTEIIGFSFASARKSGVAYTFGRNQQDSPFGKLVNTHIGVNYKLLNDLTKFGVVAEYIEHPTMSDFQGLRLNASHEIEFGTSKLSIYGTQGFVFNNARQSKDGSNLSSIGLNYHIDDEKVTNIFGTRYAKSRVSSYSNSTGQTKVWWRDDTVFSGTSLRKFTNHKLGIGGYYKSINDIRLSDQIDGRLIWIFDQPSWQTKAELFWTKQKYKSDSSNLRDDENTVGVSVRYVRQINKNISFHVDGTFSEGSKSSRHPNPVNATEARSKTVAQNTVVSLGINYQF